MEQLWHKRVQAYHKNVLKYLRYVFNDHFILALLFLAGALSLSYADFLKKLALLPTPWWSQVVVLLVCVISLQFGKLATLVKPADSVFLLAKEVQMQAYLQKALVRSALLNAIFQVVIVLILAPFLAITLNLKTFELCLFGVVQLGLKILDLAWQKQSYYQKLYPTALNWLIQVVILGTALWFNLIVAGVLLIGVLAWFGLTKQQTLLNWKKMIECENKRMYKLYAFFNLFTDVPFIQTKAKRRKYLDWLLRNQKDVYSYLYWRNFVRNSQYSGLYLRLTCLGAVIIFFSRDLRLTLLIAALFIYLIGFQMIPMFFVYDEIVFTHLYPVDASQKLGAFKRFLQLQLYLTSLIYTLFSLLTLQKLSASLIIGLVLLGLSWFLANKYLVLRIKKVA